MGDNGNETKQEQAQPIIQMTITFDPNSGRINVVGPINNRTLSYGMLEMAKEAIYDLKEQNKPQIQLPKHGILNFVRKGG